MSSVNRIIVIGHVGKDPDIGHTQNGQQYARFSLATSERWKDRNTGERMEKTQWHNIVSWSDYTTEIIANRVKKGTKVIVIGKMEYRQYQGKDYVDRWAAEIVLNGFNSSIEIVDDVRLPPSAEDNRPGGAPPPPVDNNYSGRPAQQRQDTRPQPAQRPRSSAGNDEIPF